MTKVTSFNDSAQDRSSITMYYDDSCVLCRTEAHNMQARNHNNITLIPVDQGLETLAAAGFSRTDAMTYLCIQDWYGTWHTRMDAVRLLYRTAGVKGSALLYLPVIQKIGNLAYPFIARNRYRIPNWLTQLIYGKAVVEDCDKDSCKTAPTER